MTNTKTSNKRILNRSRAAIVAVLLLMGFMVYRLAELQLIHPDENRNNAILQYTNEIRSAVLVMHGEKAHSCYMGRDAFAHMMEGNPNPENKELLLIPGAVHTDLYDNLAVIPFDKIEAFFRQAMS